MKLVLLVDPEEPDPDPDEPEPPDPPDPQLAVVSPCEAVQLVLRRR